MLRVLVQSRVGNVVLAAIGLLYAVASIAVLVWLVIDVWQASTMFDHLIQLALLGSAACGVWFLVNARENLQSSDRADHSASRGRNPASVQR